jgi:hypothetical protein
MKERVDETAVDQVMITVGAHFAAVRTNSGFKQQLLQQMHVSTAVCQLCLHKERQAVML